MTRVSICNDKDKEKSHFWRWKERLIHYGLHQDNCFHPRSWHTKYFIFLEQCLAFDGSSFPSFAHIESLRIIASLNCAKATVITFYHHRLQHHLCHGVLTEGQTTVNCFIVLIFNVWVFEGHNSLSWPPYSSWFPSTNSPLPWHCVGGG